MELTFLVDQVSHLNVIVHGQVTDGMCIFPTLVAELFQDFFKITSVLVEKFRENRAIFEARVHPLTIERDYSVTGVPNQQNFRRQMIGAALDGHQMLRLSLEEVFDEPFFAYQRNRVGEIGCEKVQEVAGTLDFIKVLERHEESDCPRKVLVRQGNHHELSARPDVEVVVGHFELKLTIKL